MPSTGLFGPHSLTSETVDEKVSKSLGAYALGKTNTEGTFIISYVGRSDNDLNKRLKDWCGTKYAQFKYGHFKTAKDAFEKECNMFHDFGGTNALDNDIHPDRPDNTNWGCPQCDVFD